jgi:KUP system potassium uptake protein
MITPAISVLSAVEGVKVVEPSLGEFVVPITVVSIVALFLVQRRDTAVVGRMFGPVMIVWFVATGACGVVGSEHPGVLKALSPTFGTAFFALAAVVLAVTGAEGPVRRYGTLRPPGDHPGLADPGVPRVRGLLPRPAP